jgi:transcriptional regulator with XRE-family HTH domain
MGEPDLGIGEVVRRLRKAQNMTLEQVAKRAGVSKSLLSQIERDQTNPTLATLWRLTKALGANLEDVLRREDQTRPIEHLATHATPVITSADGSVSLRILGPLDLAGQVEWYELTARPGATLKSSAHEPGTVEHLTVLDGELSVDSGGGTRSARAGETLRYRADLDHAIRNTGKSEARAMMIMILRDRRA